MDHHRNTQAPISKPGVHSGTKRQICMQDTCLLPSIHGPWDLNNGLALDQGRYARPWDAFCAMCEQVDPHPSSMSVRNYL